MTNTLTQPESLLLGRLDQRGVLRFVAHTHALTATAQRALTGLLTPMAFQGDGSGHPWPSPLPAAWSPDPINRQPVHYVQVEPDLVVEVEVDVARDGPLGAFRHRSTLLRPRADLTPTDIEAVKLAPGTFGPLAVKAEVERSRPG